MVRRWDLAHGHRDDLDRRRTARRAAARRLYRGGVQRHAHVRRPDHGGLVAIPRLSAEARKRRKSHEADVFAWLRWFFSDIVKFQFTEQQWKGGSPWPEPEFAGAGARRPECGAARSSPIANQCILQPAISSLESLKVGLIRHLETRHRVTSGTQSVRLHFAA